ncbi:hypothetical protein ABT203_14365 [Streptomyces sp900105245]|uniref:hypothetical protein n=1 Tax=Streptomyces sp. 900105245 TaxID=3154379 RepID=UPI00332B4DFB
MLDLLKLNVGADVTLGRVHLGISGVEAQAQLKVRLDNVAAIIDRVLTTLDRNPELLHELARDVGAAVRNVGGGARHAVGERGAGNGRAVRDVGRGVGAAAEDVGESAAPTTVQDVGRGARRAVEEVGGEAGPAVVKAGQKVGYATGSVTEKPAEVAGTTGGAAEGEPGGDTVRKGAKAAAGTTSEAPGTKRPVRSEGRGVARRPAAGDRDRPARSPSGHAPAACGTRTGSCHHGPAAAVRAGARRAALNGGYGQTRPGIAVRFPGSGERQSTSHSDRTNLPDKVVPGREYHDTTVTYRLASRLDGKQP